MGRVLTKRHVTLLLGGIASGKSVYAEGLFDGIQAPTYIATAQAFDDEMTQKIEDHKARRGPHWSTREAQIDLPDHLSACAKQPVLVDCLTLWLSNLLLNELDTAPYFHALEESARAHEAQLVLVSNEVGHSPVATTKLGRQFQNAQGALNQRMAACADKVVFVTAGLAHVLKS